MENYEMINVFDESFVESILNETIYHNPYVAMIEEQFKIILDKCLIKDPKKPMGYADMKMNDPVLNKCYSKIEEYFNKAFNIKCHLKLDNNRPNSVQYGACIWVNEKDVEEAVKDACGGVEEKKDGIYFIKINKCEIQIQEAFFKFVLKNQLNERHLLAVLLHEIGHKLYLKANIKIENDEMKIHLVNLGITSVISIGAAAVASATTVLGIAVGAIAIIILTCASSTVLTTITGTKSYSKSEGNCDNNATSYGYGKEIYEVMACFELMCNKYLTTKRNFIRNLFNYHYQRRNIIYMNIQKEINNPENSEADREKLKQILKYIDEYNAKHSKK